MTIKINEYQYSKETLEKILNRKGETLVAIDNWLIISKTTIKTSKSTELQINKTLLDLIKTLNIEDFKEFGNSDHLKQVMKDFVIYWTAKNDWWLKERWQLEKIFDVKARYYTFLRRARPVTPKKSVNLKTFW